MNGAITGEKLTFNASQDFFSNLGGNLLATGSDTNLTITSAGLVTLNGNISGKKIVVTSGTDTRRPGVLTMNGAIQAQESFTATGPSAVLNAVLSGKDATINSGTDFHSTALGRFNLSGDGTIAASRTLVLDGAVATGGSFTLNGLADITVNNSIASQDVTIAGSNVSLLGPITAKHFTVNNQGDLLFGVWRFARRDR